MLDLHELSRRPGSMREGTLVFEAPAELGTVVIAVPQGDEVQVEYRLESVVEGVLVTGSVAARAVGECVRCLDKTVELINAPIQELFYYPERAKAVLEEAGEDDEEIVVLEDDRIDLEPLLRDSVVFALPFQPLCSEDCKGLCSECGIHLADEEDHYHEVVDPRWSALQGLINETKES